MSFYCFPIRFLFQLFILQEQWQELPFRKHLVIQHYLLNLLHFHYHFRSEQYLICFRRIIFQKTIYLFFQKGLFRVFLEFPGDLAIILEEILVVQTTIDFFYSHFISHQKANISIIEIDLKLIQPLPVKFF